MTRAATERRHGVRGDRIEQHGILSALIRPGKRLRIVNASAFGALVETEHRLLPGATVDLQVEGPRGRVAMRARILRCSVAKLRASAIWYHAAVLFDDALPWPITTAREYDVPASDRPAMATPRARATQDAV